MMQEANNKQMHNPPVNSSLEAWSEGSAAQAAANSLEAWSEGPTAQTSASSLEAWQEPFPAAPTPGVETALLEKELNRVNYNKKFHSLLRSTIYALIVTAAAAVLVAVLFMPVLRIYGSSMTPTLSEGQIVVSLKRAEVQPGDIIGVYFGNKLLIKRCIATSQQWVDIDADGNVYVDGELLDEPYLVEKALGECNIQMPYQVADNAVFVLGDHRSTSVDSRNSSVGCIDMENVVGKIVLRVWPLDQFGLVNK